MAERPSIDIGLAVLPSRIGNLAFILPGLLPQCDRLFVHINGPAALTPDWFNDPRIILTQSTENLGDAQKFRGIESSTGYYFTVDDDIIYPPDYCRQLVAHLNQIPQPGLVCVHGGIFIPSLPAKGFYHRLFNFQFEEQLTKLRRILVPGTGTLGMYTPHFRIKTEECLFPNMADIWTAAKAAASDVPIYAVPRPEHWLRSCPVAQDAISMHNPFQIMEQVIAAQQSHFKKKFYELIHETDLTASRASQLVRSSSAEQLPLVSVILPTYNRPYALKRVLQSLAQQDYRDFEVIVVNDGGSGVDSIVAAFQQQIKIDYFNAPAHHGVAYARNLGLTHARGDYIAYAEDDDIFYPHHLSLLATMKLAFPECALCYSAANFAQYRYQDHAWHLVDKPLVVGAQCKYQELLLDRFNIPLICCLHDRALIDKIGNFDETLPVLEDWDFLLRAIQTGPIHHFHRPSAEHMLRINDTQQAQNHHSLKAYAQIVLSRFAGSLSRP